MRLLAWRRYSARVSVHAAEFPQARGSSSCAPTGAPPQRAWAFFQPTCQRAPGCAVSPTLGCRIQTHGFSHSLRIRRSFCVTDNSFSPLLVKQNPSKNNQPGSGGNSQLPMDGSQTLTEVCSCLQFCFPSTINKQVKRDLAARSV